MNSAYSLAKLAMKGHTVTVGLKRFVPETIRIYEGEVINFQLEDVTSPVGQHGIFQVYRDQGTCLRVDGGFACETPLVKCGTWSQEFNIARDYYFQCGNHPLLKVVVNPKPVHVVKVTDEGFAGAVVRLYKGDTVRWTWKNCAEPHNITERKYCLDHGGYRVVDSHQEPTYSGTYFQTFNSPGIYYFQTFSTNIERAFCVVQVVEKSREHILDIKDVGFTHALYEINVGDRVWVHWRQSKTSSTTPHSVLIKRICELDNDHISNEDNIVTEDSYPARPAGLLSHVFSNAGVYEILDGERPHLKSVIVVKPTPKQHVVKITKDEFIPALGSVTQGDRIWWTWNGLELDDDFSLQRISSDRESGILPASTCCKSPEAVFRTILKTVGVYSDTLDSYGLETFIASEVGDGNPRQRYCCLISQPSSRHHEVRIKDSGFYPLSVKAKKGDIVWWKWSGTQTLLGLEQVSVSGETLDNAIFDCPSQEITGAYMRRFESTGTYNFKSIGTESASYMAVVIELKEEVIKVQVSPKGVRPDPVVAHTGDIVCWMWPKNISSSISTYKDEESEDEDVLFTTRRCHSKRFPSPGVYNHTCVSLTKQEQFSEYAPDDVWSTVLVDTSATDAIVRNVDPSYFRQDVIHTVKGKDILFTYTKDKEEEGWAWSVVRQDNGELVDIENVFIPYTGRIFSFVEIGTYKVDVKSAYGNYQCLVYVTEHDDEIESPEIISECNGGNVKEGHTVFLSADHDDAEVYYTTDGSVPIPGDPSTLRYNPGDGVQLNSPGLLFVRAVAMMRGILPSKILTSKRFWVMPPNSLTATSSEEPSLKSITGKEKMNEETSRKRKLSKIKHSQRKREEKSKSYSVKHKGHVGLVVKTGKVVVITATEFQPKSIVINEGESITFQLHPEAENYIDYEIKQVFDAGSSYQHVYGGYASGDVLQSTQKWTQEFNLVNEYLFSFAHHQPLKVIVKAKAISEIQLTDSGFSKPMNRLFKGDTLHWMWADCSVPRSIREVTYCVNHGGYITGSEYMQPSKSGKYFQTFSDAGVYYFMSEVPRDVIDQNQNSVCIVQVLEKKREHLIELKDDGFSRSIFEVKSGERVWVQWKQQIKYQDSGDEAIMHSILIRRICSPVIPQDSDSSDIIVETDAPPSLSGLLSYVFQDIGVYEIFDKIQPELRCIVLVKSEKQQHVVRLTSKEFFPALGSVSEGDRVWWTWNPNDIPENFVLLREKDEEMNDRKYSSVNCCTHNEQFKESMIKSGVFSCTMNTIGLETYKSSIMNQEDNTKYCCLITQPAPKHHDIKVKDNEFLSNLTYIRKGDFVWWKWSNAKQVNSVREMYADGQQRKKLLMDCPMQVSHGAYVVQITETGTFAFQCSGMKPESVCYVIANTGIALHKICVTRKRVSPDPIIASEDDIVCWLWPKHVNSSLTSFMEDKEAHTEDVVFSARRCHGQRFSKQGMYHFNCASVSVQDDAGYTPPGLWSTVIVDKRKDPLVLNLRDQLSRDTPIYTTKGKEVLFSYASSKEDNWSWSVTADNKVVSINHMFIPHVGRTLFFQNEGIYEILIESKNTVFTCTVHILPTDAMTKAPGIVQGQMNGGNVELGHTVSLVHGCDDATVYFTTDGSAPVQTISHEYNPDEGVTLDHGGISFIRAIAIVPDKLPSTELISSLKAMSLICKKPKIIIHGNPEILALSLELPTDI